MYKEIFIALCFVTLIVAYPAENVENVEPLVEVVQVEADDTGSDEDAGDLAVDESRYYGHRGHHHHHYGGHRHYGGYGGYYGGGGHYGGYRRGGYGYYG